MTTRPSATPAKTGEVWGEPSRRRRTSTPLWLVRTKSRARSMSIGPMVPGRAAASPGALPGDVGPSPLGCDRDDDPLVAGHGGAVLVPVGMLTGQQPVVEDQQVHRLG